MDSLLAILSLESLAVILPTLAMALVIGFLFGRSGWRKALQRELELAGRQSGEQSKRTIAKMRRELDTVANLALALPNVVRDINRDDIDPADVPRLILQLANAVFEPRQILLYGFRTAGSNSAARVLTLSAHRGLDKIPDSLRTINMGEGKVGWVAKHELDMIKDDWETLRMTDRLDVPDNDPMLKADILGPMIHHAKQRQHVLGVLCIGGPRIKPRDVKLMFQMVTNFGSLALVNAWNMKKLRSAAHHDGLTGLLNKKFFLEDVAMKALIECERKAKPFSIFIFDIDHFKNFNDTNGHPAGDRLLRVLGGLIRRHLRPGDLACRYGGEEFAIAMPDTDRREAVELADVFRQSVADEKFENREMQPSGLVSVSGGVASFPKDGSSLNDLIKHADEALYHAKDNGRNRVAPYKGIEIGDSGDLPPVIEGLGDAVPGVDPSTSR